MSEIWEATFAAAQLMWGLTPTRSAVAAAERFQQRGVDTVLLPGVGYGRNAQPFVAAGMAVTGIEISETAIALARSELGLEFPIHHGSVTDMPFDECEYDAVFSFALLHLFDEAARAKLLRDCHRQLAPGGTMNFVVVAKGAPMYRQGPRLGEDRYEVHAGISMFFYDADSIQREFGRYGLLEHAEIAEPMSHGAAWPFHSVTCRK